MDATGGRAGTLEIVSAGNESRRAQTLPRGIRWLLLPAAVLLLTMIGMALSSSSAPDGSGDETGPDEQPQPEIASEPVTESGAQQPVADPGEPPSVTVTADGASIEIRFDPDGVVRLTVDGQIEEFELDAATDTAVRLGDDGGLESVSTGDFGPDDIGLAPTDGGVDVIAPGSPLVELRPDGRFGGVSATEFDGNNASPLTPPDGQVVLNDGTTIQPIEAPGEALGALGGAGGSIPWPWVFGSIAVLGVVSALTGYLLHRNHKDPEVASDPSIDWATDSEEDFERFLARLARDPDPTRAIRLGFHAVEQGVSGLPIRREDETPFEWHRRVSETVPAVETRLGTICDLFAKARFAPGDATDQDRQIMIGELRHLIHDVHIALPT